MTEGQEESTFEEKVTQTRTVPTRGTNSGAGASKFAQQLSRTEGSIAIERAKRLNDSVADEQLKLVMDLRSNVRSLENRMDAMFDLSTSNQNTALNVVSPDFNAKDFVREIHNIRVEADAAAIELQIAEDVLKEWFS